VHKRPHRSAILADGIPVLQLERMAQGWLLDGDIRQHSRRTLEARRSLLDRLLWFLRDRQLPALRGWGLAGLLGGLAAGAPGAYVVLLNVMNQGFVSPWWPLQLALVVGPPALGIGLALAVGRGVCSKRSRLPGVRRLTLLLENAGALPALPPPRALQLDRVLHLVPADAPTGRGDEPTPQMLAEAAALQTGSPSPTGEPEGRATATHGEPGASIPFQQT
jgi:hypothetical protein